jgi:hypothetical protein
MPCDALLTSTTSTRQRRWGTQFLPILFSATINSKMTLTSGNSAREKLDAESSTIVNSTEARLDAGPTPQALAGPDGAAFGACR